MKKILNFQIGIILSVILFFAVSAHAQSIDQLKQNINSHNDKIKQLDAQIKAYEKQITTIGSEAKSLQNTIKILNISQQKLEAEIKRTETNIQKTNLTIIELGGQIGDTQNKIATNVEAISNTLNNMHEQDEEPLIESFLAGKSLSDVLDRYESISQFQGEIKKHSQELEVHKTDLSTKKAATEVENKKLVSLRSDLKDQNQILANNKKEKNTLLAATKNKETEYKKILAQTQADKEKFEKELFNFESQLQRAIDPKSFPSIGKGLFSWPLDNILITQYFGRTVDAKRLYVSGTHNGIDFRASRGTPVKAVLGGTIAGIGNTDEQYGCYSYGKWVLITHPNGLSTLYGHLDLIKASTGQQVSTGDVIGYSGNTGYTTGPHLHLTVYASQGVRIQRYSSSMNCKNVSIPIAPIEGYLDPMLYF